MDLLARRSRRSGTVRFGRVFGCTVVLLFLYGCGSGDVEQGNLQQQEAAESATGEATAARSAAGSPSRSDRLVALFAGTSLTAGLGLSPEDAYPAVLQRMADSAGLSVSVVNAGESGETSANLVRRLPWLLQRSADVVVIETGANDGLRGLNVDSTTENLRRVISTVRESLPEAQLLLVQMEAPPNMGDAYTSQFRAMYGRVASEAGIALIPFLLEGVAGERLLNQADGIHPNEEGARLVALTVWPAFAAAVASASAVAR